MYKIVLLLLFILIIKSKGQSVPLRGPPIVEKAPLLLNSFLPASMQVIAHLTDLMKYEIHPVSGVTTTTTIRPTPHHRPGIYAPRDPLAYYSRGTAYQEYVERLKSPSSYSYFDRYRYPEDVRAQENARATRLLQSFRSNDLDLFGKDFIDLVKEVANIEDDNNIDDNERVERFSEKYDTNYIIGNKRVPPTRAYVTLLSLYDLLNKESKKLQLSKYGGYTYDVLNVLEETSAGSSANQLYVILSKVVERRDTKDQKIINKLKTLIEDLQKSGSYINDAVRLIPSLQFIA